MSMMMLKEHLSDNDSKNSNDNKGHSPRRRRRGRESRASRIQKHLLEMPRAFSMTVRVLVLLTIACWFLTLAYSHYKLTQVLMEQTQANVSNQQQHETDAPTIPESHSTINIKEDQILRQPSKLRRTPPPLSDPDPSKELGDKKKKRSLRQDHAKQQEVLLHMNNENNNDENYDNLPTMRHPPPQIKHQHERRTSLTEEDLKGHRFLIFEGEHLVGQGAGNLMNGLLGVHLLGDEFNRTVCIVKNFHFHHAFDYVDDVHHDLCKLLLDSWASEDFYFDDILHMVNYKSPPNECKLKELLSGNPEPRILHIQANTYVRWRSVPPHYFTTFYKPRPELVELLPQHPPQTVVHLRKEDGKADHRKGLDEYSLDALGQLLSNETEPPFLVTNNVEWYELFRTKYGWRHPEWDEVTHSALGKMWSSLRKTTQPTSTTTKPATFVSVKPTKDKRLQQMQLWADWYTLVTAKKVYHTHSDFSLSAVHWMGMDPETNEDLTWSRTILDYNTTTKQLDLSLEQWMIDPVMKRLVDRQGDELAHCRDDDLYGDGFFVPPPNLHPTYTKFHPTTTDTKAINTKTIGGLDLSNNVTRSFMTRALEIGPERMEAFRKQHQQPTRNKIGNNPMTPEQITATVSSKLEKMQQRQHKKRQEQLLQQELWMEKMQHKSQGTTSSSLSGSTSNPPWPPSSSVFGDRIREIREAKEKAERQQKQQEPTVRASEQRLDEGMRRRRD